jgi:uncharacterized RDD family membrane protein YckC
MKCLRCGSELGERPYCGACGAARPETLARDRPKKTAAPSAQGQLPIDFGGSAAPPSPLRVHIVPAAKPAPPEPDERTPTTPDLIAPHTMAEGVQADHSSSATVSHSMQSARDLPSDATTRSEPAVIVAADATGGDTAPPTPSRRWVPPSAGPPAVPRPRVAMPLSPDEPEPRFFSEDSPAAAPPVPPPIAAAAPLPRESEPTPRPATADDASPTEPMLSKPASTEALAAQSKPASDRAPLANGRDAPPVAKHTLGVLGRTGTRITPPPMPIPAPAASPAFPSATAPPATTAKTPTVADALRVRMAGFWRRGLAALIDLTLVFAVSYTFLKIGVGSISLAALPSSAFAGVDHVVHLLTQHTGKLMPLVLFVLCTTLGYFFVFHAAFAWTPGKRVLGMRIVDGRGRRIGPIRSLFRALGYVISASFFLMGFLWAAFDLERRALHDVLCGTYVIVGAPQAAPDPIVKKDLRPASR